MRGSGQNRNKHSLESFHQNTGLNHDIKISNKVFGSVAQILYLGTTGKIISVFASKLWPD
jgi:arginine utilization protein RocB